MTKRINQYFFDEESVAKYYLLGAFYSCCTLYGKKGLIFKSRHRRLVEIVKEQLESKHALIPDSRGRSSFWIEADSVPYLRFRLEKMGLVVPKSDRTFPKGIDERWIHHLTRGFIEARGCIRNYDNKRTHLALCFNNLFLLGLNEVLIMYAGVQKNPFGRDSIEYSHENTWKIYNFIYSSHGNLYLPCRKILFRPFYHAYNNETRRMKFAEKIEEAKLLLLRGEKVDDVAKKVGYKRASSLCRGFKTLEEKSITEFLKEN